MDLTPLKIEDWGLLDYDQAFARQEQMVQKHLIGEGVDTLVLVEHPATVTLGRRGSAADLHFPEQIYAQRGVTLKHINRGGLATAHEPGQLVAYPVVALKKKDVRWFAERFLHVVVQLLAEYSVTGMLKEGEPGVWVDGRKICSFGIALKKWVSSHGVAVNINNSLETFGMIVPCGQPREIVTSLAKERGQQFDMETVKRKFVEHFCNTFSYAQIRTGLGYSA
ncbi:MAG: lipoyl(octanoyl) transferase LipB [Desulfuromonadales bacterium]|nr:lipoyl(octanoyl) transferase LipB [Desulfuromonadales bacterium]MBN2792240.1 lipoyl(octanoyl) transferase LipB [Desulfuromonadales bacterium]